MLITRSLIVIIPIHEKRCFRQDRTNGPMFRLRVLLRHIAGNLILSVTTLTEGGTIQIRFNLKL